jgi:hypothetical protein
MKLMELFQPPQMDPNNDSVEKDPRLMTDINYLDDLKFFIDNDTDRLSKNFFPAIKQQRQNDSPDSFKLYLKPLTASCEEYCKEYDLSDIKDQIFTREKLEELAKQIASEQSEFIKKGSYRK